MAYDVIVAGLGAMGSAALYQSAKRGAKVLGIDRFTPPHDLGSTHGETRLTRQAIGEGEEYVPLALRSHEIWRELEAETGADLLTVTGGLIMSPAGGKASLHGSGQFIEQTVACARKFGIAHSLLNAGEIRRQFPQFGLSGDETGYYENEAGFLRPENCVRTQLELSAKRGAEIRVGERVLDFKSADDGVTVITDKGSYTAGKLIISAGPWINDLIDAPRLFKIYRQVFYWFEINEPAENYLPGDFPVFIWQFGRWDDDFIYGFPGVNGKDGGAKIATEQHIETTVPDQVGREVPAEERADFYGRYIRPHLPGLGPRCVKAVTCLYTVTPDEGFIIDRHPRHENVLIASPCSGHGFKHSAAVGEILAELALDGKTRFDLSRFSFGRLRYT